MAGEDGGDLFCGGEATGVGIREAAVDAISFSFGGVVGAGGEAGCDFLGIGGHFGLGFGGPSGGAGEGVGKGVGRHVGGIA